jgi:hypothetical protein
MSGDFGIGRKIGNDSRDLHGMPLAEQAIAATGR